MKYLKQIIYMSLAMDVVLVWKGRYVLSLMSVVNYLLRNVLFFVLRKTIYVVFLYKIWIHC